MDGIVKVKVSGNHISKDSKLAGVRGEGNSTKLKITFDEGWDKYAKTITFYDARGTNSVERTLTTDLIDGIEGDARTYTVPIPYEAMTESGNMTFIIDGYVDGKRKRSVSDNLEVKYSPDSRATTDPTPTQVEQLQSEIDKIKDDIQNAAISKSEAAESAENAEQSAKRAEASVGKTSYIGENGNWYAWDGVNGVFYDTGITAQAGSTVYYGDNPPADADIWICPTHDDAADEEIDSATMVFMYIDEDGHLICDYRGETPPPFEIGADGHLYINLE